MSTATMSSNQHRRFVNPPPPEPLGPPNKRRKEIDGGVTKPSSPKLPPPRFNSNSSYAPRPGSPKPPAQAPPAPRNQLLAGYLAHEFLTKGSLFGEPWDPARAEAFPVSSRPKPPPSRKVEAGTSSRGGGGGGDASSSEKYKRYVEVADLLKSDGAHLPGIVNPTQLARFLQL